MNVMNYCALLVAISYNNIKSEMFDPQLLTSAENLEMTHWDQEDLRDAIAHERTLDANKLWSAHRQGKPAPTNRSEYELQAAAYQKLQAKGWPFSTYTKPS